MSLLPHQYEFAIPLRGGEIKGGFKGGEASLPYPPSMGGGQYGESPRGAEQNTGRA